MKKLILSLMAAALAVPSFAQGHCAGGILAYGVGSYSFKKGSDTYSFSNANSTTVDRPHTQNWEVSPGIGFNISDYLTVGIDFNYTGSKTTYDLRNAPMNSAGYEDQVKTFDYAIGPFVRFTQPFGKRFFGFGQLEAHYLHGQQSTRTVQTNNSFTRDDKYKGVDVSYMPGVGVYVAHNMALTFGIGGISYNYQKYDYSTQLLATPGSEHTGKASSFDVTFGRQFNIGIQKTFGCHKKRAHAEPMDETRHMDTNDDNSTNKNSNDE
ncbi:MAG: outer membrane beta-barrel protein [Bacteroidetes bacterium]|nr:outer membrane beta-barrel protein [Bacteroidota bacterium]